MAWFRNFYRCEECGASWEDEWSCMCDDDCPECGSRHYSPYDSDDLSVLVQEEEPGKYAIYYSPIAAEDKSDYVRLANVNKMLASFLEKIAIALTGPVKSMDSEVYEGRTWLEEIGDCVLRLGRREFGLVDIYAFEAELAKKYPRNRHIRAKIRQQLQRLRDQEKLDFLGDGVYRLK